MKVKVALILGLLWVTVCDAGQRGLPPQEGILNFGKVNESLYRGAQPDAAAITNLQKLGVKTIISLRTPDRTWKEEAKIAGAQGITCVNVPLHGFGRPSNEQVKKVLAFIDTLPGPIFIHCQHGCDRTGTIIACYRIQHDKWTSEAALREAEHHGISKLERGMKRYVIDFAVEVSSPQGKRVLFSPVPALGPLGKSFGPG